MENTIYVNIRQSDICLHTTMYIIEFSTHKSGGICQKQRKVFEFIDLPNLMENMKRDE